MSAAPPNEPGLIETLAAGIAHEVRNPLNSVQINLGILEQELRELLPDRDLHAFTLLQKIAGEIKRLDDFVSEFLRFARPPKLNVERLAVRPLITELVALIAPECSKKGVALEPDDPAHYITLGQSLMKTGQNMDAATAFETALERRTGDPNVYRYLAEVYLALGDMPSSRLATTRYREAIDAAKRQRAARFAGQ